MMTGWAGLSILFVALAMLRPIDHDESQYVAAAMLTAHGLIPYRDYAYLQTPLQPFAFAPVAMLAGSWTWPALRIVNALLGVVAVAGVASAARIAGASRRASVTAATLFATTDILLFSIGTARNDALPAALSVLALGLALRRHRGAAAAALTGLLFAGAAAAKVSYALPALAYSGWALWHRRDHRPLWVAIGAIPVALFVAWTALIAPQGFVFGVLTFPTIAPQQYYLAADKAWKLTVAAKAIDTIKFLALGPALIALVAIRREAISCRLATALMMAGLLAALLPSPIWRQYLLPMLPPLFVLLAVAWTRMPPGRPMRVAAAVFALAGLAPSVAAIAQGGGMVTAIRQGSALRRAMDASGVRGAVATLSPQFLSFTGRLPDSRFATGPFYFRSRGLLEPVAESALCLVSRDTLAATALPRVIVTGGEGRWTSGDPALDTLIAQRAVKAGYRQRPVTGGQFRLWVAP